MDKGPPSLVDPPWTWRNCRRVQASIHLHLLPIGWHFRAWWQPEVYSLAAGTHLGPLSLHLFCDIGDPTAPGWRGRRSLTPDQAYDRAVKAWLRRRVNAE